MNQATLAKMREHYRVINLDDHPASTTAFLQLPFQLHRDDARWIPPSRKEAAAFLDGTHPLNAFFRLRGFLVLYRDQPVGRAAGFITAESAGGNPEAAPVAPASIGLFECIDDTIASGLLLGTICAWLKQNGIREVWGPMNGSIWSSYRFMLKGFDDYPFLNEPYNKSYYPDLFEAAGFNLFKRWYSGVFSESGLEQFLQRAQKSYRRICDKGYTFRSFNMRRFDDEFQLIYDLVMDSYIYFTGFQPLTCATFKKIYYDFFRLTADPALIHFVTNPDGEDCGFQILTPDLNRAFHHLRQKPGSPLAGLKYHYYKKKNFQYNMLYMGLRQSEIEKRLGVGLMLSYHAIRSALHRDPGMHINLAILADDGYTNRYLKYAPRNHHCYGLYQKSLN